MMTSRSSLALRGAALCAVVAALVAVPLSAPPFWITLLNYIGLYSIVALGLVLLTGVAGQTSFGQAAFVGIGAYVTAYLSTHVGPTFAESGGHLTAPAAAVMASRAS